MNYGIELEFFITNMTGELQPAYKFTSNLDGNPVIGELRTGIHGNILDCIYELKKLIYVEQRKLAAKNCQFKLLENTQVGVDFLRALRADKQYINRKELDVLAELSIYPDGKIGKMLPRGLYKASLQISFSENKNFAYTEYEKVSVEDKYKYVTKTSTKSYAGLFDYVSIISKLDKAFSKEIAEAKRVKGVYAIKDGLLGDRIEYRSLPNSIDLDKLLTILS